MLRVFDAAALLGVDAVCGFVGRNQERSMDQNLQDFEEHFVPLLKEAKARGLTYRVEQCPMPGWTTGDNWHNNIAYTPGTWIALHRICEKHGVGDQFRIHYDPSHAILMGQDTRSIFQYLKDEGYNFLIGGFHVKGQVVDAEGRGRRGASGGQTVERGDWKDGKPSPNPADQVNAWKKQVVLAEHELPGTARHDPLAYLQNRSVDWLDHQLAARELLALDVANTHLVVEHEYPKARIQDKARSSRSCRGRSPSSATSTKRPAACTRCSTRCWRRRASRSRASAGRPTARSARHVTHRTRRQDGRRHRWNLRHRPDHGDRPRRRRRQRRRHRPPRRADRLGRDGDRGAGRQDAAPAGRRRATARRSRRCTTPSPPASARWTS